MEQLSNEELLEAKNRIMNGDSITSISKEIKIDSDLEKVIMDGFPYDASELEMAIYIYIKMCKVLTYDEEYYAVNQMGVATEKHRSTSHIALITPQNNQVVCFEFNIMAIFFL